MKKEMTNSFIENKRQNNTKWGHLIFLSMTLRRRFTMYNLSYTLRAKKKQKTKIFHYKDLSKENL
jgi:hypothetical protein